LTAEKSNTQEFIAKAKRKFGDRFDYSKVDYVDRGTNVEIICPIHGSFFQTPHTHLIKGTTEGCPKCAIEKKNKKKNNAN
jgi:hypothetical protein